MKSFGYFSRRTATVAFIAAAVGCDDGESSLGGSPPELGASANGGAGGGSATAAGWVHPGALDAREELDFVRAQVEAGAQPWKGMYDRLASLAAASRTPHGLTSIDSTNGDANTSRDDALGAYTQALLWWYSGDDSYAERAIAILNAWANLAAFTGGSDQDKLQAGWIGAVFAPAAEIMQSYPGWADADVKSLQAMFRRAFYPQLNTASSWNGNVDLTQIDAIMAIAVFNEDQAEFELGLERWRTRLPSYIYLASDGGVPPIAGDGGDLQAFWGNPTQWVDGLMQETCRDNGHHAQFALGSALHAAEVAWHQGVDVYSGESARLTAAMELLASQLSSGEMQGTCANDTPTGDRYDTWEVGYNHYHNRQGLELPNTYQLIVTQIRPNAELASWNLAYETLTHAGVK